MGVHAVHREGQPRVPSQLEVTSKHLELVLPRLRGSRAKEVQPALANRA
jgi:hypothetical protein